MAEPENPGLSATVESYRRAIARLIDDIDAAISDIAFKRRGGQIVHAVDFTEIRAFVLPNEETQSNAAILDPSSRIERFARIASGNMVR
jgi:hypothetical protein